MSKRAASKPPSKLGIKPGRTLSAEQAIYALVTKSANDVATAVAEHLGGSERNFAARMTNRARQLGMKRTTFRNASGLTAKGQVTTAKDMALLGIALREHYPKYYRYFSTRSFKYGKRKYGNHNRLLGKVKGVDGIKTGYTRLSGFNLVSSVELNKRSIVAVVMGGKSGKSRNIQMQKLISAHLKKATRHSKRHLLVAKLYKSKSRRNKNSSQLVAAISLPKNGPIPLSRNQARARTEDPVDMRIQQAHMASIAYAPKQRALSASSINAIRSKLLAMNAGKAPVPQQNPVATLDRVQTATIRPPNVDVLAVTQPSLKLVSDTKSKKAKSVANKKIPLKSPGGWQVQIAAVPDYDHGLSLLSKTRAKMPILGDPKMFGELSDYIEPIVKNGQKLYRIRFAGFHNKNSARAACKAMKRRKIDCLAIKG